MGVELLEIGFRIRKGLMFTMRGCFRSVCNHPFLVCVLCVLMFTYRSSPFMFSLLVSVSPILVCTAVLLGTLLSFGEPNIPELEIEERTNDEAMSVKSVLSRDATVVEEENERYYVERYNEKSTKGPSLSATKFGEFYGNGSLYDSDSMAEESSQVGELENDEIWELSGELGDMINGKKSEWDEGRFSYGEAMENPYYSVPKMSDKHMESDSEKSVADSFDSERVNVDCLDSPWKQVEDRDEAGEEEEEEDEEDDDDDDLDSGSDRAESSSPDASMADIMPMLDELHPLLDEEAAQPVQMSRAASEQSTESSTSSSSESDDGHESDDEIENSDDPEVAEDENEDEQGDKEEQTKSAITWTEEDQKNLMDLGSSEIERNQRLENLILRRRSRKNLSMVPEINLIDLESADHSLFNVGPISTRKNPFDLPHDDIPGSAPSILSRRRNPFDILDYYTSEEKPDLIRDEFREELTALQSRDLFFKRHESFNVGPSVFAPNRQEKQNPNLRPYFVQEPMISEESSYSQLHRESSEMSDSKLSSVLETETVGSVEELEYQKLAEEDNPQDEVVSMTEEVIEECQSEYQGLVSNREFSEEDTPRESELSEHVGHGSQSSGEDESLELGPVEKRVVESDGVKLQEDHYEEGNDSCSEAVERRYSRASSSSSLSEVSDNEELSISNGKQDGVAEEPGISTKTTVESTDLSTGNTSVDDVPHKEPVYDSSPPAVEKDFTSSSTSSDPRLPPLVVKRVVSFTERESENHGRQKNISDDIDMSSPEPSTPYPIDEHDEFADINEYDDINSDSSGADQRSESQDARPEASVEENLTNKHTPSQVPSSSSDSTGQSPNSYADYQEANEKLLSTPSAAGSTHLFYDKKMRHPEYEHLNEEQVPNTPIESFENVRSIQRLNIPEVHGLNHDITNNINSYFTSMPSDTSEASSHVDMETILEEADEIKEIDGLLSELDSVGDFSMPQRESSSNVLEKHIDSVGENSSSAHLAKTSIAEQIDTERDGRINSTDQLTSKGETIAQIPESEIQSTEDVYSFPIKAESTSLETEVLVEPPQAELVIKETIPEHSEHGIAHINTSVVGLNRETQTLVVRSTGVATMNNNQDKNCSTENHGIPDSVDGILRVVNSSETQGTSESHVGETTQKILLDEKELKPNSDDGSVEVKAEKPSSSMDNESSVKEVSSSIATEKRDHKVEAPQDIHSATSVKGKGKSSKKSSSSSSSSDSD